MESWAIEGEKMMEEILSRKQELDSNGYSPLHLAVAERHVDIARELLRIDGETGLDGMTAKEKEIECALRNAGALNVKDLHLSIAKTPSSCREKCGVVANKRPTMGWLCTKLITLVLVASLTATLAFKAGKSLWGFWHADFTVEKGGIPVNNPYYGPISDMMLFYGDPMSYGALIGFMLVPILGIISAALSLLSQLHVKPMWWMCLQVVIMFIAFSIQVAFYLITFGNFVAG